MSLLNLSEEQILAGADASSIKSGKDLATAKKWLSLSFDDRAIWGECQGSGKLPYQTIIDTQNLAYKCSCPSRKFPCKHGLGLALLYARQVGSFSKATAPDWVQDWISKRDSSQQKKVERAAEIENDPEKAEKAAKIAAKTAEKRENNVANGIADIRLWLNDWMRTGILSAPEKDMNYWQSQAARMIDAQAPGIANLIKDISNINFFRPNWEAHLLEHFALLYLLTEGFINMERLSAERQADVRNLIGFTHDLNQIKQSAGVKATWVVVGKETEIDTQTNLHIERNWLYAVENQQFALILNFAFRGQFPADYIRLSPGQVFEGELAFFPSACPLRALIKSKTDKKIKFNALGDTLNAALMKQTVYFQQYPWLLRAPMFLADVALINQNNQWFCKDKENNALPLHPDFQHLWHLAAVSGGHPVTLFALREQSMLVPLAAWGKMDIHGFEETYF